MTPIEKAFRAGQLTFNGTDPRDIDIALGFDRYLAENEDPPSAADLATLRAFCGTDHARTHHPKTYDALIRLLAAWT